jgi:kinesin family protein 2/24
MSFYLQENDMSVELYNQHEAISDLQRTEEECVDYHQKLNEFILKFVAESRELHKVTNYVDYDQDGEWKIKLF